MTFSATYDRKVSAGRVDSQELSSLRDGTYITGELHRELSSWLLGLVGSPVHLEDSVYEGCLGFWF